jgi:kynurenine formamidase
MPATGATIVIGVPRLANGSGAPVAVTAFLP